MKIGLMIPTLNAGNGFKEVLKRINIATNCMNINKIIIDSYSTDDTVRQAALNGFKIYMIKRSEFTHGEVRRRAAIYLDNCDFIVYLTQDVKIQEDSIRKIIDYINKHKNMAIAYGRQKAISSESSLFEQRARMFNYPPESIVKSKKNSNILKIKTVFSSDAFSIYRTKLLNELGSFPAEVNYCEDQYMAAIAISNGYEVGYCSKAIVYHSNNLSLKGQFKRYRSIGKFHRDNPWIQSEFGSNESEGVKSVLSEWKYILENGKPHLIPYSILLNIIKYIGYKF